MTEETRDDVAEDHDPYENLYYRCIRFKNGETIIAGVPKDDLDHTRRQYIEVYTPVVLTTRPVQANEETGEVFTMLSMNRWMPLADIDYFEIATDTILTMCTIKEKHEEAYFNVLERLYFQDLMEDGNLSDEEKEELGIYDDPEDDQAPDAPPSKYLH